MLNPDRIAVELRGKEWVNPKEANFEVKNKQRVKTIVQKNKEAVKVKKLVKEIEGK